MDKIQGLADRLTGSSTQGNTDAGQTVRTSSPPSSCLGLGSRMDGPSPCFVSYSNYVLVDCSPSLSSYTTDLQAQGEFPKPDAFPVESQKGSVVGIQEDMDRKPEAATVQEGQDSFDHYKPASKLLNKKVRLTHRRAAPAQALENL